MVSLSDLDTKGEEDTFEEVVVDCVGRGESWTTVFDSEDTGNRRIGWDGVFVMGSCELGARDKVVEG